MKFFAAIFIILFSVDSVACECATRKPNVEESLNKSVIIFSGRVEKITPYFYSRKSRHMVEFKADIDPELEPLYYDVKMRPKKYWKGEAYKEVLVETNARKGSCGFNFSKDKDYLVYVHEVHKAKGESAGKASVWRCSRTAKLKRSYKDIIKLNNITKSYPATIEVKEKHEGH